MNLITIGIIISAVAIVVLIAIQERSSGIGVFGGGDGDSVYKTRRGVEKMLFYGTIAAIAIFVLFSILNLVL